MEQFRTGTGASNAYPKVGPVVISEIMYHPPDLGTNDNGRDEYIELHNISTVPVALFESTNAWRLRDAVDFDFAPGTVLAPGGEGAAAVTPGTVVTVAPAGRHSCMPGNSGEEADVPFAE